MILLVAGTVVSMSASARAFNDRIQNKPYADLRAWHLGFSIGAFSSDLIMTHNGLITDDGEEWRIEQPSYQPGFCVNGLIDLRLNTYLAVRFSPGLYFGSRNLTMREVNTGSIEKQNLKSTYLVAPVELKYAAMRYRNSRPYISAGVMPTFDVNKKESDFLQLNTFDCYLSVALGCDFYLPYFKLIPELKFCFGLTDVLKHDRPDLIDDPQKFKFTQSLKKATSKMIVLTFYFE